MGAIPNGRVEIDSNEMEIVRTILARHVPQFEVWAFGSRVNHKARKYSDLDLAIIADRPLPLSLLATLNEAFSESDLPWKVDLVDWSVTDQAFRQIIQQDHIVIQSPAAVSERSGRE